MTIPKFDERRSAAIRAGLVDVARSRSRPRPAWAGLAVFALAGVLTGGAVSTAVAVTNQTGIFNPDGTVAEGNPGIPAPDGVLPGAPVISLLGTSTTDVRDGTGEIALDPPTGATHVRVTFTCLRPGSLSWGLEAGGNNPSVSWSESDVESRLATSEDIPLDGAATLYLEGSAGYAISLQYLNKIETAWGVNERGETYGAAKPGFGEPDLLAAIGVDGDGREILGYVRTNELGGEIPAVPGEAAQSDPGGSRTLPLLDRDGVTQIGEFIDGG